MSRFKRLWVLLVPTAIMLALGSTTPVHAAPPTQPAAPIPDDACGTSDDKFFVSAGQPLEDINWRDSLGNSYAPGVWNATKGGAASVTLTATVSTVDGTAEYTYPAMTFSTEPDSSCVDVLDTVTAKVLGCNSNTNGTKVAFTYTNVAENGRPHTDPQLIASRWDAGQTAVVVFRSGEVADGESVTVTGGDDPTGGSFFLAPGTYNMRLYTKETGVRKLPNTFFVSACGKYPVPPGDPSGQGKSVMPKGWLKQVNPKAIMKMRAINRKVTHATFFRLKIDPRHGKTTVKSFKAKPNSVVKKVYNGKVGTKYVLKAKVKVNGKWKWLVLKRAMLRSLGS